MLARKKSPIIDHYSPLCADCHLVLEMDSDSSLNSFVNYLKETVYSLRIRKSGSYIERHNNLDKIPSFKFPRNVNDSFSTLQDISNYFHEHYPLNFEDGYAAIASSTVNSIRKYAILSVPHFFADGKYFSFLIDNFLNNDPKKNNLNGLPDFPLEKYMAYRDFYEKAPNNVKSDVHDDKLTRFSTNDSNNLSNGEFDQYITLNLKSGELKNKVVRDNQIYVSNFTESLYMSNYFAICAHENKFLKSFGIINVIDLKKYFQGPITFAHGSEISFVSPYADGITPDMKIIDVGHKLRKSLIEKLDKNEHFANINSIKYNESLPRLSGIVTEFSNIGGIHIRKPIKNLWMALFIKCVNRETCSNMGFSVIRDDFENYNDEDRAKMSQNDIILRYRYSPRKISLAESTKLAKTIDYFLKNISLHDIVGNAYDEVKKFYNSI